ncbi:hypothetical protein [Lysobacter rhizosphaerae]
MRYATVSGLLPALTASRNHCMEHAMNPLMRYATVSGLLLALTACHPLDSSPQTMSKKYHPLSDYTLELRHNPQPTQAYKISLMLINPPGPFAYIRGVAQYDVMNTECLPPPDSNPWGVTSKLGTDEPIVLTQVSANGYEGVIHADLMRDEDYIGRGVCHWQLTEVRVRLRATGAESETRFVPSLAAESVLAERSQAFYFWKGLYPRARMDNFADYGETDVGEFKPEVRGDLFGMILTAKKVQP